MTRDGALAKHLVQRDVRLTTGEAVRLCLVARFNRAGALVGISAPLPPAPRATTLETEAARLVEAIGGKMLRRPDIGITELRRRAEAALALLEQLEELEAQHGAEARAVLRDAAA